MNIRTEFLVGKQKRAECSIVYGYRPEEEMNTTELFGVMRISSNSENIELEKLAKVLFEELQMSFYSSKNDSTIVDLEDAVWKMKSKMDIVLSREDEIAKTGIDIEVGICVIEKHFLYAAVVGESKIFIKRGDSFVDISKGLIDTNMMGFVKTGSLKLEEDDRVCLCTSKASSLGNDFIELALAELSLGKIENFRNESGVALLILASEGLNWKKEDYGEVTPAVQEIPHMGETQEKDFTPEEDHIDTESQGETITEEGKRAEEYFDRIPEDFVKGEEDEPTTLEFDKGVEHNGEHAVDDDVDNLANIPTRSAFQVIGANLGKLKMGAVNKFGQLKSKVQEAREERKRKKEESAEEATKLGEEEGEYITDENTNSYKNLNNKGENEVHQSKIVAFFSGVISGLKSFWKNKIAVLFKDNNKTYAKFLRDIGRRIQSFFGGIWEWFRREVIGTGDRRDVYLKSKRRKRNRWILIIAVIVIGIFLFVAIRNRQFALKEQERIDGVRAQVSDIQTQVETLSNQVDTVKTQDDQTKTSYLSQLTNLTSTIETLKQQNLFLDDLSSVEIAIQASEDAVQFISPFTESQIISDFGKLYPDANLTDIVYLEGNLYISDVGRNNVYQLGTALNSQPVQFATGFTQPQFLIKDIDNNLIFYDNDPTSSVGKISISENGKVTRYPGLSPSVIGKVTDAAIFSGNDALYEIHQNHQQIFKREKLDDTTYNTGGAVYDTNNPPNWRTDPEFGDAIDISVPYDIYVLIKGKGLRRYLAGGDNSLTYDNFVNFSRKDYDSLIGATCMDISGSYVAICDPLNKRVLLFTMDDSAQQNLTFIKQYVYRGNEAIFTSLKELAINDSGRSIYVLDGSKVERLEL